MPAFNSTNPNLNWAVNRLNHQGGIFKGILDALQGGMGSVAPKIVVELATQWAIGIANDNSHGYDQAHRLGPDYDCSSLVASAWNHAGLKGIKPAETNTRNMREKFMNNGFVQRDFTGFAACERGDVLWKSGHCAMYCGNNQIVEAAINELGTTRGGRTGDQTGNEIRVTSAYGSWTYVLRWMG